MTQDEMKCDVANSALKYVVPNTIIGVGTGSTANFFIDALAIMKDQIIGAVASSLATQERLEGHGITVFDLNEVESMSVYIDGADESDAELNLIKGGGGALTREKIVAAVAGGAPTDFRATRENSKALSFWLGGSRAEKPEIYDAASPAAFVDKDDAPVFFYNGSTDLLVPVKIHRTIGYAGPTALHAALEKAGVETDLHIIKGAGHLSAIMNRTALEAGYVFLDKHLKGSNKLRVFLLAGQSNMQGQGVVDFDHPEYYNGGRGILKNVMKK